MSTAALRILLISPYCPSTGWGFGSRVYHLTRQLSNRHLVTVLSYVQPGDDVAELRRLGVDVRLVWRRSRSRRARRIAQLTALPHPLPFHYLAQQSRALQSAVDGLLDVGGFDIVQLESSQLCGVTLDRHPSVRVVLDEHNIEYELLGRVGRAEDSALRRFYGGIECLKCRMLERRLWKRVDGCAFTSEREASIARHHAPGTPTVVAPNGVDHDHFSPSSVREEPDTIIFAGLLTYRPNLDAARWLVNEILPRIRRARPDVVLTIVGHGEFRELVALERPGVLVRGWVPDLRVQIARAAVEVVPLRMGSGTRLKVVEGLAMAKPIVSTSLGCEGLGVRDDRHLLIANDADAFARGVVLLLEDRGLARRLGEAGRRLVVREYGWSQATDGFEALYQRVVGERPTGSATHTLQRVH